MFEDSFLANVIIFVAGQIAAIGYLRTGILPRGIALVVATWVLADVVLVARFAYGADGVFRGALIVLQGVSLAALVLFVVGRVRRGSARWRDERPGLLRSAFVSYLRDDLEAAGRVYRQLLRRDPWDLDARLGLATVLSRGEDSRRARAQLRAARALDRAGTWGEVIQHELQRIAAVKRPARPRRSVSSPSTSAGPELR